MKKVFFLVVAFCLVASSAMAAMPGGKMGFGFRLSDTPLSLIMRFNEKVGGVFGIGFSSIDLGDETGTNFALSAGLPITVIPTEKANLNVMPLIRYTSYDVRTSGGLGSSAQDGDPDFTGSMIDIALLLEVEAFISENFSVSAAHGFGISMDSPPGEGVDSSTNLSTLGNNWTGFGFTFYLPQ